MIINEIEPCEDAISRQAVLDLMQIKMGGKELYKAVYDLPPVKQEPKTEKVIKMRDATPEERESIDKYIKSISKATIAQENFSLLQKSLPYGIIVKPFSWNDNFSEIAQEDFSLIQKSLSYGTATSIGMALAKLELLEKQGCKVEESEVEE